MIDFKEKLCAIVGEERMREQEPMKLHTTFRIGGPADYFVWPETQEEIGKILALCREYEIPWFVMGNGSNLLVSDQGYRGVILQIFKNYNKVLVEGECLKVQAGALLSACAAKALEAGLTGMEFASGIPGTIGGAVVMNAGAYGGEMKDILESVTVLTKEGDIRQFTVEEMEMGYRTSIVKKRDDIVLETVLRLKKGNPEEIRGVMDELKERRVSKQPLEFPSAGSTFKRPEGYFAGKLIMDAGLRGYQVGGAQVSEKHCGFVINKEEATAADVMQLMKDVQRQVQQQFGVELQPEVRFLGEF